MEIKKLECAMEEMFDFIGDIPSRVIDFEFKCDYDAAFAELEKVKSDDVVEVVRCKDCAFSCVKKEFEDNLKKVQEREGVTICRRLSPYIDFVPLDGYCHAGIKPEDVPSRFWPLDMRSHDETKKDD